jgi:hypothetical protein
MNGQLVSLLVLQVIVVGAELWTIYRLVVALKKGRWLSALLLVSSLMFYMMVPVLALLCLVMQWWKP